MLKNSKVLRKPIFFKLSFQKGIVSVLASLFEDYLTSRLYGISIWLDLYMEFF